MARRSAGNPRVTRRRATIPVILVSANRDTVTIAEDRGADGFVGKPFDLDDGLTLVRHHLDSADRSVGRVPGDQPPVSRPAIAAETD